MNLLWMFPLLIGLVVLIPNIHAETIIQSLEGGMDIETVAEKTPHLIHKEEVDPGMGWWESGTYKLD